MAYAPKEVGQGRRYLRSSEIQACYENNPDFLRDSQVENVKQVMESYEYVQDRVEEIGNAEAEAEAEAIAAEARAMRKQARANR